MAFVRDAVTKAILRALRKYLVHVEQESVSLGLWAGDLTLQDVELKTTAFNSAESPLTLVHGAIRSIRIQVPWTSFWRQPVQVKITGVEVEVESKTSHDIQAELDEKNRKVQELHADGATTSSWSSWMVAGLSSSLLDRLLKSVAVTFYDVHVFYAGRGFRLGLTLGAFSLVDHASKADSDELLKAVTLSDVAIYVDEDANETAYHLLSSFHVHSSLHQPTKMSPIAVETHVTKLELTLPPSFISLWRQQAAALQCYAHGRRHKVARWRHLHCKSTRSVARVRWQYAIDQVLCLCRPRVHVPPSTLIMASYAHLYASWLQLMQARNTKALRLVAVLNVLELQLTTREIFECQAQAQGARQSQKRPNDLSIGTPYQVAWTWALDEIVLSAAWKRLTVSNTWQRVTATGTSEVSSHLGLLTTDMEVDVNRVTGSIVHNETVALLEVRPRTDVDTMLSLSLQATPTSSMMHVTLTSLDATCHETLPSCLSTLQLLEPDPPFGPQPSQSVAASAWTVTCSVQTGTLRVILATHIVEAHSTDWYLHINAATQEFHHRVQSAYVLLRQGEKASPVVALEAVEMSYAVTGRDTSVNIQLASVGVYVTRSLVQLVQRYPFLWASTASPAPLPRTRGIVNVTVTQGALQVLLPLFMGYETTPMTDEKAGLFEEVPAESKLLHVAWDALHGALWSEGSDARHEASLDTLALTLLGRDVFRLAPLAPSTTGVSCTVHDTVDAPRRCSLRTQRLEASFEPEILCDVLGYLKVYCDLLPARATPHPGTAANATELELAWHLEQSTIRLTQEGGCLSTITLLGTNLRHQSTLAMTVERFTVQDSTAYGSVHHYFIVPMECACAADVTAPMLDMTRSETDLHISMHGLQFTCLYRFYLECWNYAFEPTGALAVLQRAVELHFPSDASAAIPQIARSCKSLRMSHVALVFPRNSESDDRLALVMDELLMQRSYVDVPWTYAAGLHAPTTLWPARSTVGHLQRDILEMRQCRAYCADAEEVCERYWSFAFGTLSASTPSVATSEAAHAPRITAHGSVFQALNPELRWSLVSLEPTTIHFVRDTNGAATRDLYVFSPSLRLEMDVTEWSILLSLWFDNMGEYAKFPRPFVQHAAPTTAYDVGPHPFHAPFNTAAHLDAIVDAPSSTPWEVGVVCPRWELQFELKDDALGLVLSPLVVTVTGTYESTFLTTAVVAGSVRLTKLANTAESLIAITSFAPFTPEIPDRLCPFWLAENDSCLRSHAFHLTSIRFPYGYTMLGMALDIVELPIVSDPTSLTYTLEYFSTFFYDPAFGYPWPSTEMAADANGDIICVGAFLASAEDELDGVDDATPNLWYSLHVTAVAVTAPVTATSKTLVVTTVADAHVSVHHTWNASTSSLHVQVNGVEAYFLEAAKRRTVLTPIGLDWHYTSSLDTAQTSHVVDVKRYDPMFPASPELTVYVYGLPSDVAFVQAVADTYAHMTDASDDANDNDNDDNDDQDETQSVGSSTTTLFETIESIAVTLPSRVCLMLLDDALQFQKPLLMLFLSDASLNALRFTDTDDATAVALEKSHSKLMEPTSGHMPTLYLKLTLNIALDVFNNIVRGWEPLVERFELKVLAEDGPCRGAGLVVSSADSIQVNITEYCLNLALELCHDTTQTPSSTSGVVNRTGRVVRYFQPQPDAHQVTYLGPAMTGSLHSPPIVSVLYEDHMLETTVENQNYLRVLFLNYDAPLEPLRHALASNAAALTYDMSLQLRGFRWLHHVDVSQSGTFLFDLIPDDDDVGALVATSPWIRAALRCVVGITKTRYGQTVALQSQFELVNATSFVLGIRLGNSKHLKEPLGRAQAHATSLQPSQVYYVPLQPLFEYADTSRGKHIGYLYLMHVPHGTTGSVTAIEGDSIDLLHLMTDTKASYIYPCSAKVHLCIEVAERSPLAERRSRWSFFAKDESSTSATPKTGANLTRLVLHAPLTLENALCVNIVCCVYRLVVHHGKATKDIVWEGSIKVGGVAYIYSSTMQDVLYGSVLLPGLQCESTKPVTLHVPPPTSLKDHRKVDVVLELNDKRSRNTTRSLKLKIEHLVGGGGQRAIVLYAPYWLVNYTPYALQYKQETRHYQVAGSAGAEDRRRTLDERWMWKSLLRDLHCTSFLTESEQDETCMHVETAATGELCGCPSPACAGRRSARFATMFSFSSAAFDDVSAFANSLCIKCPKYTWSKGFSLEALGIDQVVELKNSSGVIPVSARVSLGPDVFYRTKCVTFTPRYLVFNQLHAALALYDAHDNLNMTMAPNDAQPYHPSSKVPVKKRALVSAQYVLAKQAPRYRSGKFGIATTGPLDVTVASLVDAPASPASRKDAKRGFAETKAADGHTITVRQHSMSMDVVRVHSRFVGSTVLTVFRPLASSAEIGYRIENQTSNHLLFYRQASVEGPRNAWQVLRPGAAALFTWPEPMAPHQLSASLRNDDARAVTRPKHFLLSSRGPKKDVRYIDTPKTFGRTILGERRGLGLDDVDAIALDVLNLQVAIPKPTPRLSEETPAAFDSTKVSSGLPHLNFPTTSMFQKPKRAVSYARIDGDGMTRVLRLRESATLDDERSYFLKEEVRMQQTLLSMLALQHTRAFAALQAPTLPRRRSVELESVEAPRSSAHHRTRSSRRNSFSGLAELSAALDAAPKEPSSIFNSTTPEPSTATSRFASAVAPHPSMGADPDPFLHQLHARIASFMSRPIFETVDQVLVTVVSAMGLQASVASEMCHPYVALSISAPGSNSKRKTGAQKTYYIERCHEPSWYEQTFLFDLDGAENASLELDILSYHALSAHPVLGTATLPLRDFDESNTALTLPLLQHHETKKATEVTVGSIDIHIAVCRSTRGLLSHWYERLKTQTRLTSEGLVYVRSRLNRIAKERILEHKRKLHTSAEAKPSKQEMTEKAKQLLLKKKDKLVAQKNRLKVKWHEQLHNLQHHHMNDTLQTLKVAAETRILRRLHKSTKPTPMGSLQRVKRLFSNKDGETNASSSPTHAARGAHPSRNVKQVDAASIDHVTEVKSQFERLVRRGGTLRVVILEGRGFAGKGDRVRCKLTSEGATFKTNKIKGDDTMQWRQNSFEMQLRRQRGSVTVTVLNAGTASGEVLLGMLHLSIEAIIEFCVTRGTSITGWFPLVHPKDTTSLEKDLEQLVGTERIGGGLGYSMPSTTSPCLRLQLQYELAPTSFVVGTMLRYASIHLREVALSLSAQVYPIFSLASAPRLEMQEVLRVSFDTVDAYALQSTKQRRVAIDVDGFQVDNQRSFSHQVGLPVVLSRAAMTPDPLFHATCVQHVPKGKAVDGLVHLEFIALQLQDIDLTFDEAILRTLYDILDRLYDKHAAHLSPRPPSAPRNVYIAHLEVSPFRANITFRKSYTAESSAYLRQHFKSSFTHSFAAGLVNVAKSIENAPLQFSSLLIRHEITDAAHVRDVVLDHYTTSLLRQLYKLVGAMNFMGNPVGLAASVRDGLTDFVVAPYLGMARYGARGLLGGMTRGTLSLVGHTAFGVLDTTSRLTTAMGNSVMSLSRDRVYAAKRTFFALARPSSRREQLKLNVNKLQHDMTGGLLGGLTGLLVDPMRGAQNGPRGLFVGVANGLSGVVVKPVVGAIDLTTHVLEGLRDVAGLTFDSKQITEERRRKRIAHTFGGDGRLLPHDPVWNWAKALLVSFDPISTTATPRVHIQVGDVFEKGQVLWTTAFKSAPGEYLVVVVRKSELLAATVAAAHWQQPTLKWRLPKDYVHGVALHKSGGVTRIVLYVHKPPSAETQVHIGTVPWEDSRNFENDERKLLDLFTFLSRSYHVVGGKPGAPDVVSPLQKFAFERLLGTQEMLKTQYCLHAADKDALAATPWTRSDDDEARRPLWKSLKQHEERDATQVDIM
ncbi:hypothetical protein SDRG_03282 [Saprolegnia diclina VS20]|uniref:C2 domain-containing protein n=1 Tax=Saprolegnia diclina (strain VS20) TaxID=1156394 RepID=T0QLY9_SAPDV|nr:hypothetical protein SDRG_03282 [Saprolegnia diclina VS20]EQC39074.1 hypothetical protein SDRG_03282 [Saprolegnia diclina VS20]|eukprot:XP_008607135.1 hypothetical protein SDRG_03282 [Saprolegnia diclina VS20]